MDPVVVKAWIDIAYGVFGLVLLSATIAALIVLIYYMIKKL